MSCGNACYQLSTADLSLTKIAQDVAHSRIRPSRDRDHFRQVKFNTKLYEPSRRLPHPPTPRSPAMAAYESVIQSGYFAWGLRCPALPVHTC